jgi:hypothetical protein
VELLNDNESKKKLVNAYAHQVREDPTGKKVIEKYSHRPHNNNKSKDDDIISAPVKSDHRWEATFSQQLSVLTERAFKQSLKVILSNINLVQAIALSLICCLIWYQMPFSESSLQDRVGNVSIVKKLVYIDFDF